MGACYNAIVMKNRAIILIGKSGSGKGTQAERLAESITQAGGDVHRIEMGEAFRDFLRQSNYTADLSREVAQKGGLQPDFLANYFLTEELVKYSNGTRNFIFDGTPRTTRQARVLDGALRFYGIENPLVVHLEVSNDSVIGRMKERGRDDDHIEVMKTRLEWFETDTLRAVDFFRQFDDYYQVVTIDGEQDIDAIARELHEIAFD